MGLDAFKKPALWTKVLAIIFFIFCSFIVHEYSFSVSELGTQGVNNFLLLASTAAIPVFIILVCLRVAGKDASASLEGSLSIVWCIYALVALVFCLLGHVAGYYYIDHFDPDNSSDKEWVIKIVAAVFFLLAAITLVIDCVMSLKCGGGGGGGGGGGE